MQVLCCTLKLRSSRSNAVAVFKISQQEQTTEIFRFLQQNMGWNNNFQVDNGSLMMPACAWPRADATACWVPMAWGRPPCWSTWRRASCPCRSIGASRWYSRSPTVFRKNWAENWPIKKYICHDILLGSEAMKKNVPWKFISSYASVTEDAIKKVEVDLERHNQTPRSRNMDFWSAPKDGPKCLHVDTMLLLAKHVLFGDFSPLPKFRWKNRKPMQPKCTWGELSAVEELVEKLNL